MLLQRGASLAISAPYFYAAPHTQPKETVQSCKTESWHPDLEYFRLGIFLFRHDAKSIKICYFIRIAMLYDFNSILPGGPPRTSDKLSILFGSLSISRSGPHYKIISRYLYFLHFLYSKLLVRFLRLPQSMPIYQLEPAF